MRRIPLVTLFAVLGACAGGSGNPDAGVAPKTYDDYAPRFIAALCTAQLRCNIVSSLAECEKALTTFFTVDSSGNPSPKSMVAKSLAKGRAAYDSQAALNCLASLTTASCDVIAGSQTYPPACAAAIAGKVASGGSCFQAYECSPDSFCTSASRLDSAASGCPGSCASRSGDGTTTQYAAGCATGLYTYGSGGVRTCRAPTHRLQSCAPVAPGTQKLTCVESAYCENDTCVARKPAGDMCGSDAECVAGTFCQAGACGPLLALDQACARSGAQATRCRLYSVCLPSTRTSTTGTCQVPGVEGSNCIATSDCASGFQCLGATANEFGKCAALKGKDGACNVLTGSPGCAAGFFCNLSNVCQERKPFGSGCLVGVECLSGVCTNLTCASTSTCIDPS